MTVGPFQSPFTRQHCCHFDLIVSRKLQSTEGGLAYTTVESIHIWSQSGKLHKNLPTGDKNPGWSSWQSITSLFSLTKWAEKHNYKETFVQDLSLVWSLKWNKQSAINETRSLHKVILLFIYRMFNNTTSRTNGYIMTIFSSVNKHSKCGRIQHRHYFAATKQRNQTKK